MSIRQSLRTTATVPVPVDRDDDLQLQARPPVSKRPRTEGGNFTEEARATMWQQLAFLAKRHETRLSKKGREIRSIPERFKEEYAKSDAAE